MKATLFFPPLPFLFQVLFHPLFLFCFLLFLLFLYAMFCCNNFNRTDDQFSTLIYFDVQGLVLGWGGLVATYLITASVREYRQERLAIIFHTKNSDSNLFSFSFLNFPSKSNFRPEWWWSQRTRGVCAGKPLASIQIQIPLFFSGKIARWYKYKYITNTNTNTNENTNTNTK